MTITLSTDPIVFAASVAYHLPRIVIKTKLEDRRARKYDRKIAKSQEKLAETTLVPGYTRIYA